MPSLKDFKNELEKLDEDIKANKNDPVYDKVQKALDKGGFILPYEKTLYDQIQNNLIAPKLQRKTELENLHSTTGLSLGHVYAASSILDWVLVRVNQSRMGDNAVRRPSSVHTLNISMLYANL